MSNNNFGSDLHRRIILVLIIGMFSVQIFQLVDMQLLESTKYDKKSKNNSIKTMMLNAPRGIIFDRNMEILVGNKPSFTLQITPAKYNPENTRVLEGILNVDSGYVNKLLDKYRKFSKYKPRTLMRSVDYTTVSWLEENYLKLSGISYVVETKRDYSFGIKATHILGYAKEIDRKTLRRYKDIYAMGDNIGYSGIEKKYEEYLRGKKGKEYSVVDSRQRVVGSYNEGKSDIAPIKGNDIVLSLDFKTQKKAEELMSKYRGSFIAMDPTNGEIIAYVSSPQYNLSNFAGVTSTALWDSLRNDKAKPLFNRGTIATYPPGSTYKMLVAITALEEGIINPSYTVNCGGGLQFGDRFFKCTHTHGKVTLKKAIEESCNTYFYQLIRKVGLDNLSEYSKKFHLGMRTGVDITPESAGLMPNRKYYNKVYGKKWSAGHLLNISIGQGEVGVTPIQLVQYTSLLANSGVTQTPHFAKGYIKSNSNAFIPFNYDTIKVDVSKKTFKIIQDAMWGVVNKQHGTGIEIRLKNIDISGKTGTSQNPHGKDHSIFIAYAPSKNPKIAIAVIIENAGYGSTFAAPVAQKIITTYLDNDKEVESFSLNNNAKVKN